MRATNGGNGLSPLLDDQKISDQEIQRRKLRLALFTLLLFVIVTPILIFQFPPSSIGLQAGEVSKNTIKSPRKVRFISQILTKEAKDQAAQDPNNSVYDQDTGVAGTQKASLLTTLGIVSSIRSKSLISREDKASQIEKIENLGLSSDDINFILSLDDQSWLAVAADASRVLDRIMSGRVYATTIADSRARTADLVSRDLPFGQAALVAALTRPFIVANMVLNQDETTKRQQDARQKVEPVYVDMEKGQTILRDGEIASPTDIEKLEAVGLRQPQFSFSNALGIAALAGLSLLIIHFYVYFFAPEVAARPKLLLLLGIVVVVTILAAKVTIPGHAVLPYFFPLAAVSMLLAVLLDVQLAIVVTVILSLFLGFMSANWVEMVTLGFVTGMTGIFGIWKAERSITFIKAGIFVAMASFLVAVAFRLLTGEYDSMGLLTLGGASLVNGGLSASLTFATFSLLGGLFGITTVLQLLELAHPNQPLLRRLMREAPGTYHHSIVVSGLVEQAAEIVGGDPLLSRVAAYYHDIGKIVRPYFFIDNQTDGENVHDNLDPRTSAHIIAGHVKDGVQLAAKGHLPHKIGDIIAQHHGTSLISFFYHRALQEDARVSSEEFRYPGPKPRTKEAALMMLADSVEAAVRAYAQSGRNHPLVPSDAADSSMLPPNKGLSSELISQVVNRVIDERLSDGQLDECDLTFKDLDRVRRVFAVVLEGIYHPRIEYPQMSPRSAALEESIAE